MARSTLAKKLKKDLDTYHELVKLKEQEVEAVMQVFRGELKRESKRSFLRGFFMNSIFFILGAASSALIAILAK